jgi:spermidine synthase
MNEEPSHSIQYTEFWSGGTGLTFGIEGLLFSKKSAYQDIQVWQTDALGRLLTLDGLVMITEYDEFVYHEMISHPALCLHPNPRQVLVVGGGDGGTVREVLRHRCIGQVDLVEIDQMVLDVAREFFPNVCSGFSDARLRIHVQDGVRFVSSAPGASYDVVIVDSTDPVGIAEGLFADPFYQDCARILRPEGVLVAQTESPLDPIYKDSVQKAKRLLSSVFPKVAIYLACIPTYAFGLWSFSLGSKQFHPVIDFDADQATARLASLSGKLKYYNSAVHAAAFALPSFVQELVGAPDPAQRNSCGAPEISEDG